jgi:hypothetical protein
VLSCWNQLQASSRRPSHQVRPIWIELRNELSSIWQAYASGL